MQLFINELEVHEEEGISLLDIVKKYKPQSDIVILNSFQTKENKKLNSRDRITLIKRGESLCEDELRRLIRARSNPEVVKVIGNTTVGIAGLGGLGSTIALSLARTGIKKLILVDYDVVEPSNLNRQQYFMRDLGSLKTKALKQHIEEINPFINVKIKTVYLNEHNILECFKECEIVMEAFDNSESKAMLINKLLIESNKIIISGNGMAGYFSSNEIRSKSFGERLFICGDGVSEAKEYLGLMAPRVLIVAGHMANTVVRIITGEIKRGKSL